MNWRNNEKIANILLKYYSYEKLKEMTSEEIYKKIVSLPFFFKCGVTKDNALNIEIPLVMYQLRKLTGNIEETFYVNDSAYI